MLQCKKTSKFTRHEQVGKDGLRTNYLNTGNNVSQISASVHLSCRYDSQNSVIINLLVIQPYAISILEI